MTDTTYWEIQCPARCASRGCREHRDPNAWRKSARVDMDTSEAEAVKQAKEYAVAYPGSGPYRLQKTTVSTSGEERVSYIDLTPVPYKRVGLRQIAPGDIVSMSGKGEGYVVKEVLTDLPKSTGIRTESHGLIMVANGVAVFRKQEV